MPKILPKHKERVDKLMFRIFLTLLRNKSDPVDLKEVDSRAVEEEDEVDTRVVEEAEAKPTAEAEVEVFECSQQALEI